MQMLKGLEDLSLRRWYKRIWVRQEVWAAKTLLVRCGDNLTTWSEFWNIRGLARCVENEAWNGLEVMRNYLAHDFDVLLAGFRGFHGAEQTSEDEPRKRKLNILDLIMQTAGCGYSNPRDRIYALLGISTTTSTLSTSKQHRKDSLPVDYQKSQAEVFVDLTIFLLDHGEVFDPKSLRSTLCLDAIFGTEIDGHQLPSWAIDWRHPVADSEAELVACETLYSDGD